jgi:hypothetical protein
MSIYHFNNLYKLKNTPLMKTSAILFSVLLFFSACNNNGQDKKQAAFADDHGNSLRAHETESIEHSYEHLGRIIGTVKFSIPDTAFDSGYKPWIELENPGPDIARLTDADQVLISAPEVTVVIDYPLKKEFLFKLSSNGEFTKGQLAQLISDQYKKIYQAEEKSATIKTIPPKKRKGLANRNETNGEYGIWGHDLSDLVLSAIQIHQQPNGEIILSLEVES